MFCGAGRSGEYRNKYEFKTQHRIPQPMEDRMNWNKHRGFGSSGEVMGRRACGRRAVSEEMGFRYKSN